MRPIAVRKQPSRPGPGCQGRAPSSLDQPRRTARDSDEGRCTAGARDPKGSSRRAAVRGEWGRQPSTATGDERQSPDRTTLQSERSMMLIQDRSQSTIFDAVELGVSAVADRLQAVAPGGQPGQRAGRRRDGPSRDEMENRMIRGKGIGRRREVDRAQPDHQRYEGGQQDQVNSCSHEIGPQT